MVASRKARRYERVPCIYCGSDADTRDHVPPKSLLDTPYPPNLLTVPACRACNSGFAADEQYLLVVLAQIGTSRTLLARVSPGGQVDRTLTRSPGLEDRIIKSLTVDDEGRVLIAPEHDRINRVVAKIALGLYVLRYGRIPLLTQVEPVAVYPCNVLDQRPPEMILGAHTERFKPKRWNHIQPEAFSYMFVRRPGRRYQFCCIADIHQTVWAVACLPPPVHVNRMAARAQLSLDSFGDK